ncbi:RNA-directed DNA polymerase (Reverse transcriptase) [Crinalium epipsammum PCC 9333]|uniref:RNA-directed DNA polymerase (Reverse transcriptase) n=1 Tax=Crinalium epipsammum PCC 9333 TaxID=1173022 RepID=K9W5P8_9CYAN|nr:group II intron reverse transcriptase/maturase [Crinalium epipsammum]AFZ15062.1 RNA-directed DNA polymerase (Reverse transcriptase) [Crinalium epipsammum PCC 9333]
MSNTQSQQLMVEWSKVNWRKLEIRVQKLQKRIFKASSRGDIAAVRRLQKTLMKSWSGKMLAVRRVTQDNQGKKTAGVDGVKSLTPVQRLALVRKLALKGKSKPTRRVWIDKPGTTEKRPLGIPTMYDRALQALVKLALEPEWEARFEPNSYGFRPGRSCHDAIGAIFVTINQKAKYVLDADIAKCFDRINHRELLKKLNTFPTLKRQIGAWLKSGVMDGKQMFPTSEGTPQGGVISPLLANIALHGMEERIKQFAETLPSRSGFGKRDKRKSLSLIRYADDFVILHEDITVVKRCKEIISEWLMGMGLELKPSKTRLAHTLIEYEGQDAGFNFLGFNIRQYPAGKYNTGCNTVGKPLGFKTLIKPSKEKIKIHYDRITEVIEQHKTATQAALIAHLNPIIKGWANYYRTVSSKETFSKLGSLVYRKLRSWAKRRHPNKSGGWVADKYWQTIGEDKWVFATRQEGKNPMWLLKHNATEIVRHVKVQSEASPYDGNLVYWSTRMGNNPEVPKTVATLLKKQKGKCAHCKLNFTEESVMEVDHIVPKSKGGKNEYKNMQLLHRHCHDEKTASDGSLGTKSGCNSAKPKPIKRVIRGTHDHWSLITEEPCEVKVSSTVLKTSGSREEIA